METYEFTEPEKIKIKHPSSPEFRMVEPYSAYSAIEEIQKEHGVKGDAYAEALRGYLAELFDCEPNVFGLGQVVDFAGFIIRHVEKKEDVEQKKTSGTTANSQEPTQESPQDTSAGPTPKNEHGFTT